MRHRTLTTLQSPLDLHAVIRAHSIPGLCAEGIADFIDNDDMFSSSTALKLTHAMSRVSASKEWC